MVSPEQELEELEEEAQSAIGARVPVRRFGQPVQRGRQRQQAVLRGREAGREQVRRVGQARTQLKAQRQQQEDIKQAFDILSKRRRGKAFAGFDASPRVIALVNQLDRGEAPPELQAQAEIIKVQSTGVGVQLTPEQKAEKEVEKIEQQEQQSIEPERREGLFEKFRKVFAGEAGGQSLPSGETAIVTPEGDVLFRTPFKPEGATEAEVALGQSLPENLRNLEPSQASFALNEDLIPSGSAEGGGVIFSQRVVDDTGLLETEDFEPRNVEGDIGNVLSRIAQEGETLGRSRIIGGVLERGGIGTTELIFGASAIVGQDTKSFLQSKEGQALAREGVIGLGGVATTLLALQQDKEEKRFLGELSAFSTRVVAEAIPVTAKEVAVTAGTVAIIGGASRPFQRLLLGALGGFETTTAIVQPDLSIEKRVAKGIMGVTALAGAGAGADLPLTRFQRGERLQRAEINALEQSGQLTKQSADALRAGVKAQKFARGSPDLPTEKTLLELIPKETSVLEKELFLNILFQRQDIIFGSQAVRARGLQELGGDIDKFSKMNRELLDTFVTQAETQGFQTVQRGEAVSLKSGTEKAFDLKSFERRTDFLLSEKSIKFEETQITKLSEQASRGLSGAIQLRKGGKDIGSAILGFRALVETSRFRLTETKIPLLKQARQIRQRKFEKLVSNLEKALPELTAKTIKAGESKIAPEALALKPLKVTTAFPLPTVSGKGGRLGGLVTTQKELRGASIKLPKRSKAEIASQEKLIKSLETKLPKIKTRGLRSSRIKPSRIKSSRLPKSFLPSRLPTSRLPSLKPSRLGGGKPSRFGTPITKIPKIPKIPTSRLPPSKLPPSRPPTRTPPPRIPPTRNPPTRPPREPPIRTRRTKRRQKLQKRRGKRFREDLVIVPDLTSRVAGLTVKIPKAKVQKFATKGVRPLGLRKIPVVIK